MCANKCNYKELINELDSDEQIYFTDLNDLDASFTKEIISFIQTKNKEINDYINEKRNIFNQVYMFQDEHKKNLMKYYEKIVYNIYIYLYCVFK